MRERIKKLKLQNQLMFVTLIAVIICFISMGWILPNILTNIYEDNVYEILEQPLKLIEDENDKVNDNVAFIIISNNDIIVSSNFSQVVNNTDARSIVGNAIKNAGKMKIHKKTYYYRMEEVSSKIVLSITNDNYIREQRKSINRLVVPAMLFTSMITTLLLAFYSNFIVGKITKLKNKIDNFENDKYDHKFKFEIDDEINSLNSALEKTRISILEKEEYKRNMFQTLSHELKTPIMVISSHIEAAQDNIITNQEALDVIKKETETISDKASMILQINKLNYLKSTNEVVLEDIDLKPLINNAIERFKFIKPDVSFEFKTRGNTIFKGETRNWESIINNLLSNFIRYAKEKIVIKIYNNKITFYNDGELIDEKLIDNIFEPYTVGKKGKTGLGLAIVKQIVTLYGYNIKAINEKDGVTFVIN